MGKSTMPTKAEQKKDIKVLYKRLIWRKAEGNHMQSCEKGANLVVSKSGAIWHAGRNGTTKIKNYTLDLFQRLQ